MRGRHLKAPKKRYDTEIEEDRQADDTRSCSTGLDLIVGNAPQGDTSGRLGCGGGNINSAQRSNEEIRCKIGFRFF